MVNFWIFASNSISNSVRRGILGIWYLAKQTVERNDIEVEKGDRVLLYQPAEVREEPQREGYNYIGSFTVDSDPFIESRGEDYYAIKIRDFKLWEVFLSKNEVEGLSSSIPTGSEFGRLIHTQMIVPIDEEDYTIIVEMYGEKVEQKY